MSDSGDHWYFRTIGDVPRSGLELSAHVHTRVRGYSDRSHPRETGGILLGWWTNGLPVAVDAIELPDDRATRTRWTRRRVSADRALGNAVQRLGLHVGYIGDWHSHPADVPPSWRDLHQLRTDSRDYPNALALAVVRHGGRIDTRLALAGRLTTVSRMEAG